MKLIKYILRTAFLGIALAGAMPAFAQDVTLRYSNWLPPTFFTWEKVLQPWLKEIETVTDGRVKVVVTPKVVGAVPAQYDVVRDGLADMSLIVSGYTPGRFPMIEFGDMPLIGPKAEFLAPAMDRIYRERLESRNMFDGVFPMTMTVLSPLQAVTKGVKVGSVDDLAGMKLRASSNILNDVMKQMGVVPILKSAAEAYEMMATGTIDGQVTTLNTITGFKQTDLMDGVFFIPGGLANAVLFVGINEEKWNSISEADRAAIMAISGEVLAERIGKAYDAADAEALDIMKDAGYHIGQATPEQVEKLKTTLQPIEDAWIVRAKEAGMDDAAEVLQAYKDSVKDSS